MNREILLHRTIKEIQFRLEMDIPLLNMGGCGFFAIIMYAYMKKYGFDCKIVFYSSQKDEEFYNKILTEVKNKNYQNQLKLGISHVLIEYKDSFFDGFDFQKLNIDFERTGERSLKELAIALKLGCWNNIFSRERHFKQVHDIIKTEFEKSFSVTKELSLS